MHKVTLKQVGTIARLIVAMLLAFSTQAFAAANMACETVPDNTANHAKMSKDDIGLFAETVGCCADTGCDMASCVLLLQNGVSFHINERPEEAFGCYDEKLQNVLITAPLRPPALR